MDIIVTTPKSEMANAAREAADVLAAGGGEYFRRFPCHHRPHDVRPGSWVYYVEDGYLRGRCLVTRTVNSPEGMTCDTTGRLWPEGYYVIMDATTWQWLCHPIPMRGFQGYRYVHPQSLGELLCASIQQASIIPDWRRARPEVKA